METYLTFLLVRFGIIAAVVAVLAVALFAIAVRLKRRGRLDATREKLGPYVYRAVDRYSRRGGSWQGDAARSVAGRVLGERRR